VEPTSSTVAKSANNQHHDPQTNDNFSTEPVRTIYLIVLTPFWLPEGMTSDAPYVYSADTGFNSNKVLMATPDPAGAP
jgi:hypothetical protein